MKTVLTMQTFNIMKNYNKYICLFLLLVGMSTYAWGAKVLQFDFSEAVTGWPTSDGGSATTKTYTLVNDYTFSLGPNVYCNTYNEDTYLMLKYTTYLGLPAISGYALTKVEITNTSGCSPSTKVAVCTSSAGSSAVSGGSAKTLSTVSTTYTFNLSSTSANTVYYLYITTKNCQLKNITLTYTATSKYTVTFNAGTGTSASSSLTEGSIGAGIVLPTATPSSDCSSEYEFWGWTTEACEDETEEPLTMYFAGNKFYPESNCTLYAVYVSDKSATLDYVAISRSAEIKSGEQYIIEAYANEEDHALKAAVISTNYLDEKDITDDISSDIYNEDPADNAIIWTITQEANETNVSLYNASSSKYLWINSSSYIGLNASKQTFTIAYEDHGESYLGSFSLKNSNSKYVYYDDENDRFTSSTSSDRNLYLYRRLYSGTFNTSPVCCDKIVELSEGEENHAEFLDFSSFNQPTCSSTAADRQVTMIVEPDAGYELTSSARLEWLEATGTFDENSPTYISGPTDNGDGTYNFVYQFAQNDNGGGFFSVTATPKDYTISFNSNGGSGSMDDVEKTYNTTYKLPACTFTRPTDKIFDHWAAGSTSGTSYAAGAEYTMGAGNITFYAIWRTASYTEAKFSCAELTLTPHLATTGTPIFITSTASKTVRSQDYIEITGSGLTPNTTLTFPGLDSKFEVLTATGGTISTDANGEINVNAYIFYTPAADATTDGLDQMAGLTVSVGGAKPKQASLVQSIIGRHLPADFVIAAKRNNKWYALPDTMASLGTPKPIEIAVDNIDNPSIAYTASTTLYGLEGPTTSGSGNNFSTGDGQYIRFTMTSLWSDDSDHSKGHAPLFGSSTGTAKIGKSGPAQATNNLSAGWWWKLVQTNTSITNPQDAKYLIFCANNDTTLSMKENAGNPIWGLYKSGIDELRLIPASDVAFTEAEVVEWGQHAAIIEVDATEATGIDATSVIAHLNGASSAAISLVQTKAGDAKNNSSKYNYTVNFGDGIDFAAAASNGAMLTLEWKKDETVKAMSNIVVPKIVASTKVIVNSTNYPTKSVWDTEVHVLPGDTLEIDASGYDKKVVTISELNIYPGATVKIVGTNDSLNVRSLVLRNGWTRVGTKRYDVARLYVGNTSYLKKANNKDQWYSDWYIDYDQYYPIAVPFPVATSNISYKNTNSAATAGVRLRYYSGALRATNIQQNQDANWVEYNWNGSDPAMPTNLEPSHGYIMTARRPTGKAFSIVRMPLTFSNDWTALGEKGEVGGTHKDQVTVTAYGDESTPSYAKGWNIIANPYMSLHQGALSYDDETDDVIQYANIPDIDFKEYDQLPIETTKLKPSSAFLVQAPKDGTVTFGTANRKVSAPSYRREVQAEPLPTQRAYIVLANDEAEDMMGILVSDKYSAEYEINADLEKLLGDGKSLRTYMRYNDMNMAYVAIDKVLAQEPIPVSVRIPNDGEYTFSLHEASIVANLEGIYLIDHYEGNRETNLLEENYMFYSPAGTIADRFTINAKVGARDVPTDIDVTDAEKNSGKAVKFLYRDKLYIIRSGRIYDATGKQVKGGAQ